MRKIIFEWMGYEENISNSLKLNFPNTTFTKDKFNTEIAKGYEIISIFVDSYISNDNIDFLVNNGLKGIAIRAAGTDMIDYEYAKSKGVTVMRVANYSPESIAEYAFTLLLMVIRKLNIGVNNFRERGEMQEIGFTLKGKTIGIYGFGRIGKEVARISAGFGMDVIFFDKYVSEEDGVRKVNSLEKLVSTCNILSIHAPLNDNTRYTINSDLLSYANNDLIIINTARGDIVDSNAVIDALKSGRIAGLGIDVWDSGNTDDLFDERLTGLSVVQTNHVAFITKEAIQEILIQTIENISLNPRVENVL